MLTRILDWGAFAWRAVRLLIAGFVLAFLGHLIHAAIAAGGNPTVAAVVGFVWVALLGAGIVLWCMKEAPAMSLDLDDRSNCPLAETCVCGATDGLEVATIATPVGVYCATICGACVETNQLLPLSWPEAIELVGRHCGHLGITVDDMADQLEGAR